MASHRKHVPLPACTRRRDTRRALALALTGLLGSTVGTASADSPLDLILVEKGIGATVAADGSRIALAARSGTFEGGDEGYERQATVVSVHDMTAPNAPVIWTGVADCFAQGDVPREERCPSKRALAKTRKALSALLSKPRHVRLPLKSPPPLAADATADADADAGAVRPSTWTVSIDGPTVVEVIVGVRGASVNVDAKAAGQPVFAGTLEASSVQPGQLDTVQADVVAITDQLPGVAGAFVLTTRHDEPGSRSSSDVETWHFLPLAGLEPSPLPEGPSVQLELPVAVAPLPGESFDEFRARLPRTSAERKWVAATERIIKKHCGQLRDLYAVQVRFQKACQGEEVYQYTCTPQTLLGWQRKLDAQGATAAATLAKLRPFNTQAYVGAFFGAEDAYVPFLSLARAHYCPNPPENPWFTGADPQP